MIATLKVIFLDIDGVLNSGRYMRYRGFDDWEDTIDLWESMIDPRAVRLLNELVKDTGAKVVISSSWRAARTVPEIQLCLRARGFAGEVIGCTPRLPMRERGEEIAAWLEGHPVETFVIFDDGSDMAHLRGRLVKTTFAEGLQRSHVDEAKRMLEVAV